MGNTLLAICHRHAVLPTPATARLALKPRKIPKASKSCLPEMSAVTITGPVRDNMSASLSEHSCAGRLCTTS